MIPIVMLGKKKTAIEKSVGECPDCGGKLDKII